jgi:hypothetical protein
MVTSTHNHSLVEFLFGKTFSGLGPMDQCTRSAICLIKSLLKGAQGWQYLRMSSLQ